MEKYYINSSDTFLLIIDIQDNLVAAMKKEVYTIIENNTCLLISSANTLNIPIIVTEQYRKGLGETTEQIRKALTDNYKPIEKLHFSCWNEIQIKEKIENMGKKYAIIAGIESHVCILQTAIDLISNGYYVHVVSDAVCSRYKSDWKFAMHYLRQAGAVITTTEILVFQLLNRAGTPEFKAISPLFKNR